MNRCNSCILPDNYLGLSFNAEGVCSFCCETPKIQYRNPKELVDYIKSKNNNSKYDCAVGFSGGRDSTYLLYYMSKVLNLKVVALTVDNGYMSESALENVKKIAKKLNVDIIIKKHNYLTKSFVHNFETWISRIDPAMITGICAGCRYGLRKGIFELMQESNSKVFIWGSTPFESNPYRMRLFLKNPFDKSKSSLMMGFIKHISMNLRWVSNPYYLSVFYNEFMSQSGEKYTKKMKKNGMDSISPYYKFIHWDEKEITTTLDEEFKWVQSEHAASTWRSDCNLALLKNFLYYQTLGYNDADGMLSRLIREKQVTREEALTRVEKEHHTSEALVKELLAKTKYNYEDLISAINRWKSGTKV